MGLCRKRGNDDGRAVHLQWRSQLAGFDDLAAAPHTKRGSQVRPELPVGHLFMTSWRKPLACSGGQRLKRHAALFL